MAQTPRSTVKLFPPERKALSELKTALRHVYGDKASREDIVGALLHGTSVHQLVGMLTEYQKHDEWGDEKSKAANDAD